MFVLYSTIIAQNIFLVIFFHNFPNNAICHWENSKEKFFTFSLFFFSLINNRRKKYLVGKLLFSCLCLLFFWVSLHSLEFVLVFVFRFSFILHICQMTRRRRTRTSSSIIWLILVIFFYIFIIFCSLMRIKWNEMCADVMKENKVWLFL